MKHFSITIPHSIGFAGISTTTLVVTLLVGAPTTLAQTVPAPSLPAMLDQTSLARIAADLAYPNSAQRFFETGNAQFEAEIQQLASEDESSDPLLTVKPEILEQLEQFEDN